MCYLDNQTTLFPHLGGGATSLIFSLVGPLGGTQLDAHPYVHAHNSMIVLII